MHDGTVHSLEDAVRVMAKYELSKEIGEQDVQAIVAFMHTITGKNSHMEL